MPTNNKNYCVILAGGRGKRLWPCSRQEYPKQFIDFFGTGRTQLQQTYDRVLRTVANDHIFVTTTDEFVPIAMSQLPTIAEDHFLREPVNRNTAPSVTWACYHILRECPDANVIVIPSDQTMYNEDAFDRNVRDGLEFVASNEGILCMGITPTRPEPGYGYVQIGDRCQCGRENLYHVKSFSEKPEREFARVFMHSGEFLWNTGLFAFGAPYMINNIIKHVPEYRDDFPELINLGSTATTDIAPACYAALPNLSLEYALLEHTEHRYVQRCHFGWADIGTWQTVGTDAVYSQRKNTPVPPTDIHVDGRDNVCLHSDALFDNASGNIVRLPSGHLAVISGLDNYVITEQEGVLMICPKDDAAAMRRLQTLAHLDTLEE